MIEQRKKKNKKSQAKKKKKIKRVREFTRHNVSYVSFCCEGEVMLIIVVWLACYSYGINQ